MRFTKIAGLVILIAMASASSTVAQDAVVAGTTAAGKLPPDLRPLLCRVSNQSLSRESVMEDNGPVVIILTRDMAGDFQFSAAGPAGIEHWNIGIVLSDPDFGAAVFGMVNKPPFDVTCTVETPETGFSGGEGYSVELPPALLAALSASACAANNGLSNQATAVEVTSGVYELRFPSGGVAFAAGSNTTGVSFQFGRIKITYAYGVNANGEAQLWIFVYVLNDKGGWDKVLTIKLKWTWPTPPHRCVIIEQPIDITTFTEALADLDAFLIEQMGPAARERIDQLWQELWQALCALPESACDAAVAQ